MQTQAQVAAFLAERHIHTKTEWLQSAYAQAVSLEAQEPLTATVSRIWLETNLTVSMSPQAATLPPLPESSTTGSISLQAPTMVQIVDMKEIGTSISAQLDALEVLREKQKPVERRLVRLPEENQDGDGGQGLATATTQSEAADTSTSLTKKLLRLTVQDARGNQRYAIEQKPIPLLDILQTPVGAKILLDAGAAVVHGVILMKPLSVRPLGGGTPNSLALSAAERVKALESSLKEQRNALSTAPMPPMPQADTQQATHTSARGGTAGRGRGRGQASTRSRGRGRN
jgi:hypothetical protein